MSDVVKSDDFMRRFFQYTDQIIDQVIEFAVGGENFWLKLITIVLVLCVVLVILYVWYRYKYYYNNEFRSPPPSPKKGGKPRITHWDRSARGTWNRIRRRTRL